MASFLRMAGLRKSLKDSRGEGLCNSESAACFRHRWDQRITRIAEFPGKDGQGDRGLHDIRQRGIHF